MAKARKDILNGNILQQLLLFIFPTFVACFLQKIYGIVDSMLLGKVAGNSALAAVGATSQYINIFLNFISGLLTAATVLVAQSCGRRDQKEAREAIATGFFVSIVIGVLMTIIGIVLAKPVLKLMSTPEDIMSNAIVYLVFYFLSLPFYFIYNMGISILRAMGDSRRPIYFVGIVALSKIVLDLLLVVALKQSVLGAGLATLIAHGLCAFAILFVFEHTSDFYQYSILKDFRTNKEHLIKMIKIGIPVALQADAFAVTSVVIQSKINAFGTAVITAFTAYSNVDNLYWCFADAVSSGVTTMVSQNYGRGNLTRVRKTVFISLGIYIVGSLVYGFVFTQFKEPILSLFTNDQNVLRISCQMLMIVAMTYWVYSFLEVISVTFKSCGDASTSLIVCLIGICAVRLAYMLLVPMKNELMPIYSYPISWIVTGVIFIVVFICKRKYWVKG